MTANPCVCKDNGDLSRKADTPLRTTSQDDPDFSKVMRSQSYLTTESFKDEKLTKGTRMARPAARLSDPTSCPVPGHGTNPIATGSPDVLFDGLPAARQNDPSACGSPLVSGLSSTVIINGQPAATVGSSGAHGNIVIGGSETVIIGDNFTPASFIQPTPLRFAKKFAQVFAITDSEPGQPLANREFVAVVDGREKFGVTDASGLAHIQAPSVDSVISVHVLFRSPARALTELSENAQ